MSFFEIFIIACALSVDAFVASITCGIKLRFLYFKIFLKIAFFFGMFQAFMPVLGWLLGGLLKEYVEGFAHLIAGGVFLVLGIKTIISAIKNKGPESKTPCRCHHRWCLFGLSISTSIDAFLVGVALSFYTISISISAIIIGITTFICSLIGCFLGNRIGEFLGKYAEFIAGMLLIGLGLKVIFIP